MTGDYFGVTDDGWDSRFTADLTVEGVELVLDLSESPDQVAHFLVGSELVDGLGELGLFAFAPVALVDGPGVEALVEEGQALREGGLRRARCRRRSPGGGTPRSPTSASTGSPRAPSLVTLAYRPR
jgi:hypothetical protein